MVVHLNTLLWWRWTMAAELAIFICSFSEPDENTFIHPETVAKCCTPVWAWAYPRAFGKIGWKIFTLGNISYDGSNVGKQVSGDETTTGTKGCLFRHLSATTHGVHTRLYQRTSLAPTGSLLLHQSLPTLTQNKGRSVLHYNYIQYQNPFWKLHKVQRKWTIMALLTTS